MEVADLAVKGKVSRKLGQSEYKMKSTTVTDMKYSTGKANKWKESKI